MDVKPRDIQQLGEQVKDAAQEFGSRARAAGSAVLDRAKGGYSAVQERTVMGAKATDKAIRTHPYQFIGVAFGVGLLLGIILKRK